MRLKNVLAIVLVLIMCVALVACNGGNAPAGNQGGNTPAGNTPAGNQGGAPAGDAPEFIKIGVPNPNTGPIASFGIGTPWAEELAAKAINDEGGIYIKEYDKKIPIKIITIDTEGNSTKASEVTQKLIEQDGVHMLIARHTPDTALPVSAMGERYGVPTVSLECPVDPWLEGGPYEWVYHSFWRIDTVYDLFIAMWQEAGFGPGTVIGGLYPNDPDGLAWHRIFSERLPKDGYVLSDPGRYPMMNQDWTTIINQFRDDGVEIITGCDIAPDFASFASQAAQQGLEYKMATLGRAFLFPADANANPVEIAEKLTCEVWWTPWHPFKSSLTGMTCQEMADLYEKEFNIGWSPPMGYKYAGVEIAIDALKRAESLDPVAIRDAIGATDLETIIGHIKYDPETHVAETPIVGAQWVKNAAGDAVEIKIVYNDNNPHIPKNAELTLP